MNLSYKLKKEFLQHKENFFFSKNLTNDRPRQQV